MPGINAGMSITVCVAGINTCTWMSIGICMAGINAVMDIKVLCVAGMGISAQGWDECRDEYKSAQDWNECRARMSAGMSVRVRRAGMSAGMSIRVRRAGISVECFGKS